MKKTPSKSNTSQFLKRKLAIAIAAQVLAAQAFAAPQGGEVVGGEGSIDQSGLETTITQETDRLAIDWQSFDVGVDERVEFIQPDASAIALNRILGANGSEILGRIDANGHVVLVNPHGVVFGENATVNVGGLIASGLDINPDDFLNGDLVFQSLEGTDGAVINSGLINASVGGNVALIGKQVENDGYISAKLGSVTLAAGKEAVLTFDEGGLLGVQVTESVLQEELGDKAGVSNTGDIQAESGRILLTASKAKDVFSQAVNSGEQARSVVYHEDGSFTLGSGSNVINTGSLDASGEALGGSVIALGENISHSGEINVDAKAGLAGEVELHSVTTTELTGQANVSANAVESGEGGDIKLQGKNIGLFDDAVVSATGANGGGEILVGGDREGLNEQVRNAEFVYIGENSHIDSSATKDGDGGKLITYAEDSTRIYGNLSARGGDQSGDGGFVETSGKQYLAIPNTPEVGASNGKAGSWLIDPYDITIGSFGNINADNGVFESSAGATLVEIDALLGLLAQGGDVIVQTGVSDLAPNNDPQDGGDITLGANIGVNSNGGSLTFNAYRDIILNGVISLTGNNSFDVEMSANNDIQINQNIVIDNGNITLRAGDDIIQAGLNQAGNDSAESEVVTANGFVTMVAGWAGCTLVDTCPTFDDLNDANSGNGSAIHSIYLADDIRVTGGPLTLIAADDINIGDGLLGQSSGINIQAGSDITIETSVHEDEGGHQTEISSLGNVFISANDTTISSDSATSELRVKSAETSGGDVYIAGPISSEVTDRSQNAIFIQGVNLITGADYDDNEQNGSITKLGGQLQTNGGSIKLNLTGDITLNNRIITSGGDLYIGSPETPDPNGMPAVQPTSLTAENSSVNLGGGNLSVYAGNSSSIAFTNSGNDFSNVQIQNAGSVNLIDSNDITIGFDSNSSVINENLTLQATSIANDGSIRVGGSTSLIGAGGNIILDNASNDFEGAVTFSNTASNTVQLFDQNEILLGGSGITLEAGQLNVTATAIDLLPGSILNAGSNGITLIAGQVNLGALSNTTNLPSINVENNESLVLTTDRLELNASVSIHNGGAFSVSGTDADGNYQIGSETAWSGGGPTPGRMTISAGDGTDSLSVLSEEVRVTFDGGANSAENTFDSISGYDGIGNNNWNITASGNDTLNGGGFVDFLNVEEIRGTGRDDSLTFEAGSGSSIRFDGAAGSDSVDYSNITGGITHVLAPNGLEAGATLSGVEEITGNGDSNSRLELLDGSDAVAGSNTWSISGSNAGSITLMRSVDEDPDDLIDPVDISSTTNFSGIANLSGGALKDTFEFVEVNNVLGSVSGRIEGGGDGSVTDEVDLSNVIDAQIFTVGHSQNSTANYSGIELFRGNSAHTLSVLDGNVNANVDATDFQNFSSNVWQLDSEGTGSVTVNRLIGADTASDVDGETINFENFGSIVGGNLDDSLSFALGGSLTGSADLGAGFNSVEVSSNSPAIADEQNVIWLEGPQSVFTISRDGSDLATSISGIGEFIGGDGNDLFDLITYDLSLAIDGGAGTNAVDFADVDSAETINISLSSTGGAGSYSNIQSFVANDNENNTFSVLGGTGSDSNAWRISDSNTGDVVLSRSGFADVSVAFANFSNLAGDVVADTFTFEALGELDGTITGGTGIGDSVDYSAVDAEQNISLALEDTVGANLIGVESITANLNHDNTLLLLDGANIDAADAVNYHNNWTISDADIGSVSAARGDANSATEITFFNFGALSGEQVADTFTLGSATASVESVDGGAGDNDTLAGFNVDTLWNISGTDIDTDQIDQATNIQTLQGGSADDRFIFSSANTLNIIGGDATTTDTVDFSNVVDTETVDIVLSPDGSTAGMSDIENFIGNGNENNTLTVSDGNQVVGSNTWIIDSVNGSTVTINRGSAGGPIQFSGFSNLAGGDVDDVVTLASNITSFSANGGSNSLTLNTAADTIWAIDYDDQNPSSGSTIGITGFIDTATGFTSLLGGTGSNTFNISNSTADPFIFDFSDSTFSIRGNSGQDTVDFSGVVGELDVSIDETSVSTRSIETVAGNNVVASTLTVLDSTLGANNGNNWTIDGSNSGSVEIVRGGNSSSLSFSSFASIGGETVSDLFDVTVDGSLAGGVDGGAGQDNTLSVASAALDVVSWDVGSEVSVTVNALNKVGTSLNIQSVVGGAGIDSFSFSDTSGAISADGGDGLLDEADYSGVLGNIQVELGGSSSNGVSNVEVITGNNDGTSGSLYNSELSVALAITDATPWSIKDTNSGTVQVNGQEITFNNFNQLLGGGGVDTFDISADVVGGNEGVVGEQVVGIIDGRTNNDEFNISSDVTGVIRGGAGNNFFNILEANLSGNIEGTGTIDTLTALESAANFWIFDENGSAVSNLANQTSNDGVTFTGIEAFVGSDTQDDTFSFSTFQNDLSDITAGDTSGIDTIDYSSVTNAPVEITLGAGGLQGFENIVGNESSVLTGPGVDAVWAINVENSGQVTWGATGSEQTTLFQGFENLRGQGGEDTFALSANVTGSVVGGANSDTFDIGTALIEGTLDGGAGGDVFNVLMETQVGGINGNTGNDEFNFGASVTGDISGGSNDDTFNVLSNGLELNLIGGTSASDNDEVVVNNGVANYWVFDNDGSAVSGMAGQTSADGVQFSEMESLVGAEYADDTFIFYSYDTDQLGDITAGDGVGTTDTVDYSNVNGTLGVTLGQGGLAGFERLVGNGANSTLTGPSEISEWTINASGNSQVQWTESGTAVSTLFVDFDQLVGGSEADTFVLNALVDGINGGGGSDTLNLTNLTSGLTLGLGLNANQDLNVVSFETINANGDLQNRLYSNAANSVWTLNDINAGTLNNGASITFTGFNELQGANANTFNLLSTGSLVFRMQAGSLIGSGSNSEIRSLENANEWHITGDRQGTLTSNGNSFSFSGVNTLSGGAFADEFHLDAATSLIDNLNGGAIGDETTANRLIANASNEGTNEWIIDGENAGTLTAMVNAFTGINQLWGYGGADTFLVQQDASLDEIQSRGGVDVITLAAGASVLTINSGGAGDTITLQNGSSAEEIFAGGGANNVFLQGNASVNSITGGVGVDTINLSGSSSVLTLNTLGGNDQVTLEDTATADIVSLGDGSDTIYLADASNIQISLDGGDHIAGEEDVLSFEQYDSAIVLGDDSNSSFEYSNIERVIGAEGLSNTLYGFTNEDNDWLITGDDEGTLEGASSGILAFENFGNLTGSDLKDTFTLQSGSLSGELSGGIGENSLTVRAADGNSNLWNITGVDAGNVTGLINSFVDIQSLLGGADDDVFVLSNSGSVSNVINGLGGSNTLERQGGTNRWEVTGVNTGNVNGVASFENIDLLVGGAGVDTFILQTGGSVASIAGGNSQDILDLTNLSTAQTINLTQSLVGSILVSGIDDYRASVEAGIVNQFIGNASNNWQITGTNSGSVTPAGENTVAFSGFNSLVGGSGQDVFEFGENGFIESGINGAGSANRLEAYDHDNTWDITGDGAGTLSWDTFSLRFSNIDELIGGSGIDNVTLSTAAARIAVEVHGGGGVNTLTGGPAANSWMVNSAGLGSNDRITQFQNFEHLIGLSGSDTFALDALGDVERITGADQVDLSNVSGDLDIGIAHSVTGMDISIESVSEIIASNDRLVGAQADYTWMISGDNSGNVNDATSELVFSGISDITGGLLDQFVVTESGSVSGLLDGGAGAEDSLEARYDNNVWAMTGLDQGLLQTQTTISFANIENLIGGAGVDTFDFSDSSSGLSGVLDGRNGMDELVAAAEINIWNVLEINEGNLNNEVDFVSVENLTGGARQDIFILQDGKYVTGLIHGQGEEGQGPEGDVLDMSLYSEEFFLSDFAPTDPNDGAINFLSIEHVETNGIVQGGYRGGNEANTWYITGINTVRLERSDGSQTTIPDVSSILGGNDTDLFIFEDGGSISGFVDGASGTNSLEAAYANNIWTLTGEHGAGSGSLALDNNGTPVQLGEFRNIQNLYGSNFDDVFIFENTTDANGNITGFGSVENIYAQLGSNTIQLSDIDHTINISSNNFTIDSGVESILSIADGVDILQSGAGIDTFNISSISLELSELNAGGGSRDVFNTGINLDLRLNLQTNSTNLSVAGTSSTVEISGFEQFIANENRTNRLTGFNLAGSWSLLEDGAGLVEYTDAGGNASTIRFENFMELVGGNESDQFNLQNHLLDSVTGGGGDDTLSSGSLAGITDEWLINNVDTGELRKDGNSTVRFVDINNLTGGAGTDEFDISGSGSISGLLDGGDGLNDSLTKTNADQLWTLTGDVDTIQDLSNAQTLVSFQNIESLTGSGSDHLQGADQNNNWNMSGVGTGTITDADGVASTVSFDGFAALLGGLMADAFTIADTAYVTEFIDGGASVDSVSITQNADITVNLEREYSGQNVQNLLNINQVESVTALEGNTNTLIGSSEHNAGYTWTLAGDNAGLIEYSDADPTAADYAENVTEFTHFSILQGGIQNDRFALQDNASIELVNGGGGTDFVDLSNKAEDLDIAIGAGVDDSVDFNIESIEGLVGNNDGSESALYQATLRVSDGDNSWNITASDDANSDGINDGFFLQPAQPGSEAVRVSFIDFNNLVGGSGNDTFVVDGTGTMTGILSGGGGQNTLNASSAPAAVDAVILSAADLAQAQSGDLVGVLSDVASSTPFMLTGIQLILGNGANTSLWGSTGDNNWQLDELDAGSLIIDGASTDFSNVANLRGRNGADIFVIAEGASLTGWLSGGAGTDSLRLESSGSAVSAAVADAAQTVLQSGVNANIRSDIETVYGSANAESTLFGNTTVDDVWGISDYNQGRINKIEFEDFGYLMGDAQNDAFIFGDAGALSGLLDGGAGTNSVALDFIQRDVSVSVGLNDAADIQIANIQDLTANGDENFTNSLYGPQTGDADWQITGANSGNLSGTLDFTNFANLIGGAGDDTFAIIGDGQLSGYLDGGDEVSATGDTVNFSDLSVALNIIVGGDNNGIRNIETLIGNAQLTLQGPDDVNTWSVIDQVDAGVLRYNNGSNTLNFSGVSSILGGNSVDTFNMINGYISGQIAGGAGDDQLNLTLTEASAAESRSTEFDGGIGNDGVQVLGIVEGYNAAYSAVRSDADPQTSFASLSYSRNVSDAVSTQRVRYKNTEEVQQYALVDQFVVNGTTGSDLFVLGAGSIQANGHAPVEFRAATIESVQQGATNNIEINAGNTDIINIDGAFDIGGDLVLKNASVLSESGSSISASTLSLVGVQNAGLQGAMLETDITNLRLENVVGPVYLHEEENLVLSGISTLGDVHLLVDLGLVSQNAPVVIASGTGDEPRQFNLEVTEGDIQLNADNVIGAEVSLAASGAIDFNNQSVTQLGTVTAETFNISSTGSIGSSGPLVVSGLTSIDSATSVNLTNVNNDLNELEIVNASAFNLVNSSALTLASANTSGAINLESQGLSILGPVNASALSANAGDALLNIASQVNVSGLLQLAGTGASITGQLNAADLVVESGNGGLVLNAPVIASGQSTLRGQNIQLGNTLSTGSAVIEATGSVVQAGAVISDGEVSVKSADSFSMADQASIEAGSFVLETGDEAVLGPINAGQFTINSVGAVTQNATIAAAGGVSGEIGSWDADANQQILASEGSISLNAAGGMDLGIVDAAQDLVLTAAGVLQADGELSAGNTISLSGSQAALNGSVSAAGDISAAATNGNLNLNSSMTSSAGVISLSASSDVVMASNSLVQVDAGSVNFDAGSDVALGSVVSNSDVNIIAGGNVSNNLADQTALSNIDAAVLNVQSGTGFGADRAIQTSVSEVVLTNTSGAVNFDNVQRIDPATGNGTELVLTKVHTAGNILINSEGDVSITSGSVNTYYDPNQPLTGVIPNKPETSLRINIADGSLFKTGTVDRNNPDLAASDIIVINQLGSFGTPAPVVAYADVFFLAARQRFNAPIWAFGTRGFFQDESLIQTSLTDVGAGEQLVEVESLEEIDPAVFSAVRNYFYKDISILLPEDQRYEDDEEEYAGY